MKITRVQLSAATDSLSLPIIGALPTDPYVLKNVDGLGPPDIDLYIDNQVNVGGYYQGRQTTLRQIVLTVGLNPNYGASMTAGDLRTALYWMLSPKNDQPGLTVALLNGATNVMQCTAYIKSIQPDLFSKDPQVVITLNSTDRYFIAPVPVLTLPDAVVGGPYNWHIFNPGSVNTGFHIKFTPSADQTPLILTAPQMGKTIGFYGTYKAGDQIELNTQAGSRMVQTVIHRQAPNPPTTFNMLGAMDPNTNWLILVPGDNLLAIPPGTIDAFDFTPRYWGI